MRPRYLSIALAFIVGWTGIVYADRDIKEDTAATYIVGPFVDSAGAALTSLTIASIDITAYKNDGTAVTITPAASGSSNDMVHIDDGYYSLELTTTDSSTPGYLRLTFQIATALIFHEDFNVLPANIFDSKYSTDKLEVDVFQFVGTNATASGGRPEVNFTHINGSSTIDGKTPQESVALLLAAMAGDITTSSTTPVLKSIDGSTDRITATVDADGNRTNTLNVTSPN